ncbi:paeninodin family lasso peptide [Paenibacillus sp. LHD-117]|nr:paeninodin family lasso peptide [Paenibacillus sp. LHD-117]MDQ6422357.1 paeninodin family lasso peptide [Paenibacillus sp. LHD-117]
MKKTWEKPVLEILDVKMTMQGHPDQIQDFLDENETEALTGPS